MANNPDLTGYRRYVGKKWLALVLALGLTLLAAVWSVSAGSAGMKLPELLRALFHNDGSPNATIVWNVRLPRTVTALAKDQPAADLRIILRRFQNVDDRVRDLDPAVVDAVIACIVQHSPCPAHTVWIDPSAAVFARVCGNVSAGFRVASGNTEHAFIGDDHRLP